MLRMGKSMGDFDKLLLLFGELLGLGFALLGAVGVELADGLCAKEMLDAVVGKLADLVLHFCPERGLQRDQEELVELGDDVRGEAALDDVKEALCDVTYLRALECVTENVVLGEVPVDCVGRHELVHARILARGARLLNECGEVVHHKVDKVVLILLLPLKLPLIILWEIKVDQVVTVVII